MPTNSPDFHDQFILSQSRRPAPSTFGLQRQGEWILQSSPTLPTTVLTSEGEVVGWMLGWAVLRDGSFAHEHDALELPAFDADGLAREDYLYTLPGRWVCFITDPEARVYLDPAGSLALVYSVEARALASTTSLMNWGDADMLSVERFERRSLAQNQFYPSGLTSDPALNRLLPNHYLDVAGWQSIRHWPRRPIARVAEDGVADPISTIVGSTGRFIEALSRHARLQLPLTAGRDSRMLMCMAEGSLPGIDFVTFAYRDWRRADSRYAKSLARRLGLTHTVLDIEEPTDAEKMHYLQAVGYDAFEGKAKDFFVAAGRLPSGHAWITGFGGEIGRADYWDVTDGDGTVLDLLERLGLPASAANVEATAVWMRDIAVVDGEQLYDLMSIEQRQGCWVGPQMYGAAPFVFNIMGFNQRAVFEAMLSLPTDYVRRQMMASDVIAMSWPELSPLPFKRRWGVMGVLDRGFSSYIRLRRRARILLVGRRDSDMDPASRAWRIRQRDAAPLAVASEPPALSPVPAATRQN